MFPSLRAATPQIKAERRAMWNRRDETLVDFLMGELEKMETDEVCWIMEDVEDMAKVLQDCRLRCWVGGESYKLEEAPREMNGRGRETMVEGGGEMTGLGKAGWDGSR